MALVLRKAVLPRNVSLLKCIKGRTLATTANKNSPTPLAAGVFRRSLKDAAMLKPLGHMKCKTKQMQLPRGRGTGRPHALRRCLSCPELAPARRARPFVPRHSSLPRPRRICHDSNPLSKYPLASPLAVLSAVSFLNSRAGFAIAKRGFMSNPSCCGPCGPCRPCAPCAPCAPCSPCCSPCCGFRTPPCGSPCNPCGTCLPPPGGNHAPQCLQYMTGYYYYPYGTWFCGPYHVSGKCVPVSSTCVPPQCCPPSCCSCCITPAAAAAFMQGGLPLQDMGSAPPCQVEVPLESSTNANSAPQQTEDPSKKPRPGLSKFFPFNSSSVAMGGKAAAFPKQDDGMSSFEKKFSPKVSDATRSSSRSHDSSKFHYYPKLNTPPTRKYSRCATDFVAPKTSSPIRHMHSSKQQYVWKVLEKPKSKTQGSRPVPTKFYRTTPLAQFKPYDL